LIARSRIQTQSENSEIGIEIEIEFPDNLRMNPGDANMSFQLLIRPVSGEDTLGPGQFIVWIFFTKFFWTQDWGPTPNRNDGEYRCS
jgi:hypothetical protein